MSEQVILEENKPVILPEDALNPARDGARRKLTLADIWQFARFCVVGSLNAIIDFVVLDLLLWLYPSNDTGKILLFNSIAVLLAATNSFFWNKYWTFRNGKPITLSEIGRFVVIAGTTAALNDALILLLSKIFPGVMASSLLGANLLKLGAIIGTTSVSFFGMRLWVFWQKRQHVAATLLPVDDALLKTPVSNALIIIPTYNESENLPLLLRGIFSHAPAVDVLIVDDNSPDGTGKLAEEFAQRDVRVHVLHRAGKLGLGTAYIAGFKYAIAHNYDAAFEMDADFSHDPRYLPDFLDAIQQADLVIGSRYIAGGDTPNWSLMRRLISGIGNAFARFMLGISVHDCTGGYRCYRRHVLQSIDLDSVRSRGYAFQIELTQRVLRQQFKIVETPIVFMDRRLGSSKMSRKIVIEALTFVIHTRFSPPQPLPTPLRSPLYTLAEPTDSAAYKEEFYQEPPLMASFMALSVLESPTTPLQALSKAPVRVPRSIRRVRLRTVVSQDLGKDQANRTSTPAMTQP